MSHVGVRSVDPFEAKKSQRILSLQLLGLTFNLLSEVYFYLRNHGDGSCEQESEGGHGHRAQELVVKEGLEHIRFFQYCGCAQVPGVSLNHNWCTVSFSFPRKFKSFFFLRSFKGMVDMDQFYQMSFGSLTADTVRRSQSECSFSEVWVKTTAEPSALAFFSQFLAVDL